MAQVAYLPLNGNIDDATGGMTGTIRRASSGSYFDQYGIMKTVNGDRTQLVDTTAQNDITGWWSKTRCSNSTANAIIANTENAQHYIYIENALTLNKMYTLQAEVKAGAVDWCRILHKDGVTTYNASFNIATGVEGTMSTKFDAHGIEDVGSGWYKIWVSFVFVDDASDRMTIQSAESNSDIDFVGDDSTTSTHIRNIMIEEYADTGYETLEPSEYINSLAIPAVPRFTVDGLLLEGPGTNVCLRSRELDTAPWTFISTTATLTQNQVGIDGVANSAWHIEDSNTGDSTNRKQSVSIPADSNRHCLSAYVKKDNDETRFPGFSADMSGGAYKSARCMLNTKTGASTIYLDQYPGSTSTVSVDSVGDWWRINMFVENDTTHDAVHFFTYPARGTVLGTESATTVGSIVVDMVQVELDQLYPSSPIVTVAAAVTRATEAGVADTSGVQWDIVGADLVINGDFAADTDWTKGDGWSIAAGVASSDGTQLADSNLQPTVSFGSVGVLYKCTYTVSGYSAGNVQQGMGYGTGYGSDKSANGTYTEYLIAFGSGAYNIRADSAFIGDVDNVVVTEVSDIVPLLEESLGPELVTDGGFDIDISEWNATAFSTATISLVGGKLRIDCDPDGVNSYVQSNNIALVEGTLYKLTAYHEVVSGGGTANVNNKSGTLMQLTGVGSATGTVYFTAVAGDYIVLQTGTANATISDFDNVSVKEVLNDSRGTMTCDWTPGYDATLSHASLSVISSYNGPNLFYTNADSNSLRTFDGTNLAASSNEWDNNVTIKLAIRWGINNNNVREIETGISVNGGTWVFGISDIYDGAYAMGLHLILSYGNIYPQTLKNIRFFDEPMTDAEIESGRYGVVNRTIGMNLAGGFI